MFTATSQIENLLVEGPIPTQQLCFKLLV